jgi:uncharacterized protein YbjQ (UPF0145 family)
MTRSPTTFAFATLLSVALAGMSACAPDAVAVRPSGSLQTYGAIQGAQTAAIKRVVGPVSVFACRASYDVAKNQAAALKQLQARALQHGGDGVTGVQFTQITNTRSPCWHGVEATGLAVVYTR